MELTNKHLEAIREVARTVRYGSVTIHINDSSDKLDLTTENRVRLDKEPGKNKLPQKA